MAEVVPAAFLEQFTRLTILPGREMDELAYSEYYRALKPLTLAQLTFAVDRALVDEMFVPTPAKIAEYSRDFPLPARDLIVPLEIRKQIWKDASEAQRTLDTVRANPYRLGMDPIAYVEMIAVKAGLMKPEDAVLQRNPSKR